MFWLGENKREVEDKDLPIVSTTSNHQYHQYTDPTLQEPAPYCPPETKKGIVIERPYSYYKAAPKQPQSVTKIDSPFGPPESTTIAFTSIVKGPANLNVNGASAYYTHPSQHNPFVPPSQYQPSRYLQNKQLPSTRKERPDPEDSIPAPLVTSSSAPSAATTTMMTETIAMPHVPRERSNSDRYHQRTTSPRPDKNNIVASTTTPGMNHQMPDPSHLARSHSNGNGVLQSRQHYVQEQHQLQQEQQNQHSQSGPGQEASLSRQDSRPTAAPAPVRKTSGKNLFRMARQASDSAFRSVGLSRKSSDKNQIKASQTKDTAAAPTFAQNSQAWNQQQTLSQPTLLQDPQNTSHHAEDQDPYFRTFDMELGRNRSLPDIKPPSASDHRAPTRGSSLTHPRTNQGSFHNRQRTQHHHPVATHMSNEPITAATASADLPSSVIQDAYGGTTEDWRQRQQAEKEARERQELQDSSPIERTGHTSINSVSTLNLPPTNINLSTLNTTTGKSTSRMLLPDRDRSTTQSAAALSSGQFLSSNHGTTDSISEPTQESTSLQKAAVQPGGILAQMQAATEVGQVVDPAMGIWSQNEGRYIQRSKTAPYPLRENRTIVEEDEAEPSSGVKTNGPLEYSKSEGYTAASRHHRQQKRTQKQEQQPLHHHHDAPVHPSHNDHVHQQPYQAHHDQPLQNQGQQHQHQYHHQQQRSQSVARSRAMSNEAAMDKDLPPTPARSPQPISQDPILHHAAAEAFSQQMSSQQRADARSQKHQPRLRSESQSESSRHHQQPSNAWTTSTAAAMTSEESVLALSRSISPPPNRRISHERTGSAGQILARGTSAGHRALSHSKSASNLKERVRYGIDMLPLPVIPSPDETLKKNTNPGILPQDVLRTLDPKTIQKVITQSVIASRIYKVLTFEEVESLKKEQDDLHQYVQALGVSLTIETRMRDASHSLIRLHENNTNIDAVKASTSQLHATTRKMDQIVHKTHQSMERLLVIQRMLLQHEGAVLNAGMRRLDGENRELSRTVLELETVRDQEKEEKLKWKKETSQLRIQSMIFPNPPGLDEMVNMNMTVNGPEPSAKGRKSPSATQHMQPKESTPPLQQQQHDARLAALENYMKELNEEISKKDERINELESQLRVVKAWTDEFAGSLQSKLGVDNTAEIPSTSHEENKETLQKQLARLQSKIENGFRALEANAHDLKIKAEEAEEAKNKALEFTATTLANSSIVTNQTNPRPSTHQQQHPTRMRNQYNRSKTSLNEHQHHNNMDLNMVLNESLLELDHQISLDHQHQNSSTSSSSSSNSPGTPTPDMINGQHARLSRNDSIGRRGKGSIQQQRQDLIRRVSRSKQHLTDHEASEPKDELVIGDAHEEIKRLNAMVDELERLVRLKLQ
ncbi:hypothetical protein BGZ50_009570 [Haplosporangium sp. Z 11]|nr:hypothetical protein BGZ50_009570 [Haplosporangium sp. Z 11]